VDSSKFSFTSDSMYLSSRLVIGVTTVGTLHVYFKPTARNDTAPTMYVMISRGAKIEKLSADQITWVIERARGCLDEPFANVWNLNELSALAKYYFVIAGEAGLLDFSDQFSPLNDTSERIFFVSATTGG
jgi:hypothetical protein